MDIIIYSIIILGAIALFARGIKAFFEGFAHGDTMPFCTTCGHEGASRTHTRGSLAVEIVLWLCLLIPGLIYSIWRLSSRLEVCSACGSGTLVPANSPVANKMRKDLTAG